MLAPPRSFLFTATFAVSVAPFFATLYINLLVGMRSWPEVQASSSQSVSPHLTFTKYFPSACLKSVEAVESPESGSRTPQGRPEGHLARN